MIRVIDLILASAAIFLISPILIVVSIILKFTGEGDIFYLQDRVGRNSEKFQLIKFATMLKNSPNLGAGDITLTNDPRVLPFGKLLRKTKINELPQLFNIIIGDMSLIGPRPLTPKIFSKYDDVTQFSIAKIKPGLSGIGSIIFRNEEQLLQNNTNAELIYDQEIVPFKAELERWYVDNQSLKLYLLLIILTVYAVIFGSPKIAYNFLPDLPKPKNETIAEKLF